MNRYHVAAAVAAFAVLAATAAPAAQDSDPAGARALHDYTLSMDKVKRYETAMESLEAAGKANPALKAESEKMGDEPDKTLADIEAKFDRHPRIFAFFARQGFSKFDAAVLPLALMDALTVAQMPQIAPKMADRVSPTQIAFCKTHLAELKATRFLYGEEN